MAKQAYASGQLSTEEPKGLPQLCRYASDDFEDEYKEEERKGKERKGKTTENPGAYYRKVVSTERQGIVPLVRIG